MEEELTLPDEQKSSIAVREPTERLITDRDTEPTKSKAVVKDVYTESLESEWYDNAVFEVRFDDDTMNYIKLPIYEGQHTDERLQSLMNYSDASNLYDTIGTKLPAFRNQDGKWRVFVPNLLPRTEKLLFKTPLTRVSDRTIKPSIGLPILIGAFTGLALLTTFSLVFSMFFGLLMFLLNVPVVNSDIPGYVL